VLAWSPDGRTMYHADTHAHTVWAYDYDLDTGTPSKRRIFAQWQGETDRPDGATVDSRGHYFVAFYRGGKITELSPRGALVAEHRVPAMCPTMPAFGGPDLRTLYVTTATFRLKPDEKAAQPHAGGLLAADVGVAGVEEPMFGG